MFTIKIMRDNATHAFEVDSITIAREGSEQWNQAWSTAQEFGYETPDLIECFPAVTDNQLPLEYMQEQVLVVGRQFLRPTECIGIVCLDKPNQACPDLPEVGGVGYQFLYKGDELYVTNSHGATIEVVK